MKDGHTDRPDPRRAIAHQHASGYRAHGQHELYLDDEFDFRGRMLRLLDDPLSAGARWLFVLLFSVALCLCGQLRAQGPAPTPNPASGTTPQAQASSQVWIKMGAVISPTLPQDQGVVVEPTVYYNPNNSPPFVMLFREGFAIGIGAVGCATSMTGLPGSWTRYENGADVVTLGELFYGPDLVVNDGTYYLFTNGIDLFSSSAPCGPYSGIGQPILPGNTGEWDDQQLANPYVFQCPAGWCMVYGGLGSLTGIYQVGLATSSSLTSGWTKYFGNPIIAGPPEHGTRFVAQVYGTWWAWAGGGWPSTLPTDFMRFRSPDLYNWTQDPPNQFTFWRSSADEGVGTSLGQVADEQLLEIDNNPTLCPLAANNSCTYMYYDASPDGSQTSTAFSQIKLAIANTTIAGLTATTEGIAPGGPAVDAFASNPASSRLVAGSGGVLINGLVEASSSGGVVAYTGSGPILGIAETTQASGALVTVDRRGQSSCLPEGSITANDLLIAGSITPSSCRDSGETALTSIDPSVKVAGIALATASTAPLANPGPPVSITQHGAVGSLTLYYWCAAANSRGSTLISPSPAEITTSYAPLSSTNYNIVTCPVIAGAMGYVLLRSASSTQLSGVCTCQVATGSSNVLDDVGSPLVGYTVPLINTTGLPVPIELLQFPMHHGSGVTNGSPLTAPRASN